MLSLPNMQYVVRLFILYTGPDSAISGDSLRSGYIRQRFDG
jgi:hypothetical protein